MNEVTELRQATVQLQGIISRAFDAPGPMADPQRRQILTQWLGNFSKNLEASVTAISQGTDMRGNSISKRDIAAGLTRMCNDFSAQPSLQRLEQVCGNSIRQEFESVISKVRSAISSI